MENKNEICMALLPALQKTRSLDDLANLVYSAEREEVIAVFSGGFEKKINVACDSGAAMIKDIINHIL